jgi:hypothetical protein
VLRDPSGRDLLGGGMILDPLASDRRRKLNVREARAAAMGLPEPADKLAALASAPGIEPDARWLTLSCNLTAWATAIMVAKGQFVMAGKEQTIAITPDRFARLAASFGKMPTTSVRRLISPLRRSIGLVECNLVRCSLGNVM